MVPEIAVPVVLGATVLAGRLRLGLREVPPEIGTLWRRAERVSLLVFTMMAARFVWVHVLFQGRWSK